MDLSFFSSPVFLAAVSAVFATGFVLMPLSIFVLAGMLRQRRSPASSSMWLLTIAFLPLIGIPLFWFFGQRKINNVTRRKKIIDFGRLVAHGRPQEPDQGTVPARTHGDVFTSGNRLTVHSDGEQAFAELAKLIDEARQSIDIQTFVLKADPVGKDILSRLAARARDGIQVRVLVDGLGSISLRRWRIWGLRRAGGKVCFFLPVWGGMAVLRRGNLRNHRKIAIFDGTKVFTGGRNLASEYLGPSPVEGRWCDMSFVLEGPSVARFAEIFRNDWRFAAGEELPEPIVSAPLGTSGEEAGAVVRVIPSGPDVADDAVYLLMLSMLLDAKQRLWIVTPYFIPNETLLTALLAAIARGVDVRIVVPAKGDQILPDMARAPYLRDLRAAGAQVLLYEPAMIHAKAVLIDHTLAAIGSANFDARSMFLNFEVTSLVSSPAEIASVEKWIATTMQKTRPGGEPVGAFTDTIHGVARLLAPLL